jgi:formylmethanofuran dehydrogenase subunit E
VAGIVARDIGAETRKVDYSTDVYQNQSWAIAIGGDKTKKHYEFYLDPRCSRCVEFVPPNDIYPVGYDAVCERCFDALATYCEHCETSYYNENITWVDNDQYCTDCYNALIVECARCSDELPKTNSYSEADKVYCAYCYDDIIAGE